MLPLYALHSTHTADTGSNRRRIFDFGGGTQLGATLVMDANATNLRYLKADQLRTAAGALDGAPVVSPAHRTLGTLAGALVDPVGRRVCYLVIESGHWPMKHRYALPLITTRVDPDRQALLVDAEADDLQEVWTKRFAPFSEDDLIAAIFSPRAA
jgi:hypothetical protein